jgi:hypothetical protein
LADKDDDPSLLDEMLKLKSRNWNDFWYARDKPITEEDAARGILEQAGLNVVDLVAGPNPPDCEAILDGCFSGVEVTELIHQPTLERSLKAMKERQAGKQPTRPEAYFNWNRNDLRSALQSIIERKDKGVRQKQGRPYERYVLVIHSDEFFLNHDTAKSFLEGAVFRANLITEAFLGISHEPARGCCPVFRLELLAHP